jgi:hypothetical protein
MIEYFKCVIQQVLSLTLARSSRQLVDRVVRDIEPKAQPLGYKESVTKGFNIFLVLDGTPAILLLLFIPKVIVEQICPKLYDLVYHACVEKYALW